ncbi:hypothetical protein [Methanobacterium sp. ACI-7]|uniref:hypothetical protein n=1 Tax=unclassified Methanobacterium TaxID=2627676 RepID=UPI0039C2F96A
MKVKLQFFRVYCSKFGYASKSRFITSKDPIKIKFKLEDNDSLIVLGKRCNSIFEASNVTLANAMRIINSSPYENNDFKKELTPKELDIAIEKELKELNKDTETLDCNFYVTIIIEKEVDISEEFFVNSKYFWLNDQKALSLDKQFRNYASDKADFIAATISIYISNWVFQKIAVNGIFFSAEGKQTFGVPVFQMNGEFNHILNGYELEDLFGFLNNMNSIPKCLEELLDLVMHYKVATLREKDPFKSFIFNFLALEILINKIFDLIPKTKLNDMNLIDFILSLDVNRSLTKEKWKNGKKRKSYLKNLGIKFAIISYLLSPGTALNDYNAFNGFKSIRNDIAHGNVKLNYLKFPIAELDALLNQYLTLILKFQEKISKNK